jgi:hypothetical protein
MKIVQESIDHTPHPTSAPEIGRGGAKAPARSGQQALDENDEIDQFDPNFDETILSSRKRHSHVMYASSPSPLLLGLILRPPLSSEADEQVPSLLPSEKNFQAGLLPTSLSLLRERRFVPQFCPRHLHQERSVERLGGESFST